jgi:hypothetical protein
MKPSVASTLRARALCALALLLAGNAWGRYQDVDLAACSNTEVTLAAPSGTPAGMLNCDGPQSTGCNIGTGGFAGNVFWGVESNAPNCTYAGDPATLIACGGIAVTLPAVAASAPQSAQATLSSTAALTPGEGTFSLRVSDATDASKTCVRNYRLRVTSAGGGWGDPHLTTVDGVHYDFQSAGEFTALRQQGLELQTRQTAVPSAAVPISDEYTGLRSCVSIYTAVAARIGSSRVTLQPGPRNERDPGGLQLRVNGTPVTLTASGVNLVYGGSDTQRVGQLEGRVVRTAADTIEITDARGTQLVVTQAFWASQQQWYLNVNAYQTTAVQGVMGRLAPGSWLPALPDGTSLGPRPASPQQRYQDLYERFADAWRVTDATSLFDYAPGTNTATFTRDEWPRNNPQSCDIPGQASVQPVTEAVAQQACGGVTDPVKRRDCVFDVAVTGHTGFAQSYQAMERVTPRAPGWQAPLDEGSTSGTRWKWWWLLVLAILALFAL